MNDISIINAFEGNLQNISLDIQKNKLTVFTGLSGSGKSTLLIDVLFNECQRQYLEAMSWQGIAKPKVQRIKNVSPAIVISQMESNKNPRSTVGTSTDIYTGLRMIYEKLGVRRCPNCGKMISAANCCEETEKINDEFHVYMYCCECNYKMKKLTRTDFSFNTQEGACPTCEGLGEILAIDKEKVVNESLSLEDGAVDFWQHKYKDYQIESLAAAFQYFKIEVPKGKPVKEFTEIQKAILYEGVECGLVKETFPELNTPKTVSGGRFEGILATLKRRLENQNGEMKSLEKYFGTTPCPDCHGERLCEQSRNITLNQMRLPELAKLPLDELCNWVQELSLSLTDKQSAIVKDYLLDIETKLLRFLKVGLSYLTLDRQVVTLSGGELQRMKLAAVLDSDLTGIIYILDEPTSGLHPHDTKGLISILQKLRDLGNTVLVIEHDPDIMRAADYVIDMGPGSGKFGGKMIATGTLQEILQNPDSVTGQYLKQTPSFKNVFRKGDGNTIAIHNACKFNLKHFDLKIPTGRFVTVTGSSGSGKSTLIFEILAHGNHLGTENAVQGCEMFDDIIQIDQSSINRSKRSNVATYSEIYTGIRTIFAKQKEAKEHGLTTKDFSFNSPGGRCEHCEGMGIVTNNLLFFTNNEIVCPVCHGRRFKDHVLAITFNGLSIQDVLKLSIDEAVDVFRKYPKITRTLELLKDVGLGYLELGQSLTTLSGGEGQRLKLAKELIGNIEKHNLYLLDEPTCGLHPVDVEHFLVLLNRIVDSGSSVIVVEHNQQIIRNSDWIIDLGPEGGNHGGEILFTGTPDELLKIGKGMTAKCLRGC